MYPQELLFKLKKNTHINKQATTTTTKKQEKSKRNRKKSCQTLRAITLTR